MRIYLISAARLRAPQIARQPAELSIYQEGQSPLEADNQNARRLKEQHNNMIVEF